MRGRPLTGLLALVALVVTGVSFSGAAFTASSWNPANSFAASNAFNLTVTMVDPGVFLRGTVSLQATASDGEDGSSITSVTIQRSPAGLGTWTDVCTDTTSPYSCSFDTTLVADGFYDLQAIVSNDVGGSATSATVTNRYVDNTAPSPVTMSDTGSPISGVVSLSGSATDTGSGVASVTFQYSPAGLGTWTDACTDATSPYSCSFDTTTLADGLYDFHALAVDAAGNQATSSTWTSRRVDNYFPSSTMTDPGAYLRGTVTLDATASDDGGIADVTIQRSPAGLDTWTDVCTDTTSPYSCSFDTTLVADGLYDLRAVATDNALRSTVSVVVANRRVDNTAPTATTTDPGANLHLTVTLDATASDGGSGIVDVTIQRSPAGLGTWTDVCTDTTSPYSCSFDTMLVADGLYDLRSVATDAAGNSTTSATVANRRVDNTFPTAGMTDPGAYLRGTVTLDATGSDSGSGVANVTIQRSPAGLGTWTDVCTDTTSPYSCSFNTTLVADGLYDLRAVATDNATNATVSAVVANRTVDNTAPTAVNIQTTNGGAIVGRPETNDTVTFTYSEQVLSTSILAGWDGTSQAVTVRINQNGTNDRLEVWNAANTARLPLTNTFVTLNNNYVTASATFNATMVQSGASITVTLGAQTGGTVRTDATTGTLSWPPSATATDLAGNPCSTATAIEGGAADTDF